MKYPFQLIRRNPANGWKKTTSYKTAEALAHAEKFYRQMYVENGLQGMVFTLIVKETV